MVLNWSFHSKIMIYWTQKPLHKVNELPRNYNFTPYTNSESINTIPDDVVNLLSTDQKNCVRLREALATGNLPPEIASIDCGWINSSRQLTTGEAFMILGMSEHGLEGENLRKLHVFRFCVDVYLDLFFKVQHHIKQSSTCCEFFIEVKSSKR